MKYDSNVPAQLKEIQEWFASIITMPIDVKSQMNLTSPRGRSMIDEAKDFIAPSPTLKSHERIELYCQQYWWRLLNAMQESFPFVVRLFGPHAFNQEIATPYLMKHPSNSWSLSFLGKYLPQWVEEDYQAVDKQLVQEAVELDWTFNECFICGSEAPIEEGFLSSEDDLENRVLYLQPSVRIFSWDYDLITYREEFMKQEPDYWIENDFPELIKGKVSYIVFRNKANLISWRQLALGEYQLLKAFEKGSTISAALDSLEDCGPAIYEEVLQNLQFWFQDFIIKNWLYVK